MSRMSTIAGDNSKVLDMYLMQYYGVNRSDYHLSNVQFDSAKNISEIRETDTGLLHTKAVS